MEVEGLPNKAEFLRELVGADFCLLRGTPRHMELLFDRETDIGEKSALKIVKSVRKK